MKEERKYFDSISSMGVLVFSLVASILFWVFLTRGDVYDNWYPLVGHFVASHGALIGIVLWEYLAVKGKRFHELFNRKK